MTSGYHIHWVETYTGYCSKMSRCLHWIRKKTHNEGKEIWNFSYLILFRYLACVALESLYVYLANCMHDLASNTELDSENHKMKVVLTPKFRHLSPKRNNIEPRKQTIKILNRPIFCNGI